MGWRGGAVVRHSREAQINIINIFGTSIEIWASHFKMRCLLAAVELIQEWVVFFIHYLLKSLVDINHYYRYHSRLACHIFKLNCISVHFLIPILSPWWWNGQRLVNSAMNHWNNSKMCGQWKTMISNGENSPNIETSLSLCVRMWRRPNCQCWFGN